MTLQEELETLREENRILKGGGLRWPSEWRLTPRQTEYLRLLATRELVTKNALVAALYADRDEPVCENTFAYGMSALRAKLATHKATKDIIVRNQKRSGWYLSAGDRGKIKMMSIGFSVRL